MKLLRLACNGCGADIDLPDDARLVTCRYCGASLEVTETDGAAFTRVREVVEPGALVTLQKTARYEAALAKYVDDKDQLEARLAKAERRAKRAASRG